jgi:hypothetical protein
METKTTVIWGATYLRMLPIIAAMAISVPVPAGATNVSSPSAVYQPTLDTIFVFVTGDDGQLYEKYWDGSGSQWVWQNLGVPPSANAVYSPSAVYQQSLDRIVVFVIGDNGRLYQWNGLGQPWSDWGTPPGVTAVETPSAVYRSSGNGQIVVFVTGVNRSGLYDWNGSAWEDLRGGPYWPGYPSAVYKSTLDRIYVYYSYGPSILDNYWNGSTWASEYLGLPSDGSFGFPSPVYRAWGVGEIHVFLPVNGRLYHWDDSASAWENQGPFGRILSRIAPTYRLSFSLFHGSYSGVPFAVSHQYTYFCRIS